MEFFCIFSWSKHAHLKLLAFSYPDPPVYLSVLSNLLTSEHPDQVENQCSIAAIHNSANGLRAQVTRKISVLLECCFFHALECYFFHPREQQDVFYKKSRYCYANYRKAKNSDFKHGKKYFPFVQ